MKNTMPLALLAAARTFAEGVKAKFVIRHRLLICLHLCIDLPSASSDRARQRSEGLLLTWDGFQYHLTEDSICGTNLVLIEWMTSAHVAVF